MTCKDFLIVLVNEQSKKQKTGIISCHFWNVIPLLDPGKRILCLGPVLSLLWPFSRVCVCSPKGMRPYASIQTLGPWNFLLNSSKPSSKFCTDLFPWSFLLRVSMLGYAPPGSKGGQRVNFLWRIWMGIELVDWGVRVWVQGLVLCRMESGVRRRGGSPWAENVHLYSCHSPMNIKGRPPTDMVHLTNDHRHPDQVWPGRYLMLPPRGCQVLRKSMVLSLFTLRQKKLVPAEGI